MPAITKTRFYWALAFFNLIGGTAAYWSGRLSSSAHVEGAEAAAKEQQRQRQRGTSNKAKTSKRQSIKRQNS